MPHAFKSSEIQRRAQDGGRAARAWRWFSSRTTEAASHYRDWSWQRLGLYGAGSAGLIAVSRIDPSWALSPWLLIAGVVCAIWTLRAVLLKLFDRAS